MDIKTIIAEKSKDCPDAIPGTEIAVLKSGAFDHVLSPDEEPETGEDVTFVQYRASAFPLNLEFNRLFSSDNRTLDVNWTLKFRISAPATFIGATMGSAEQMSVKTFVELIKEAIRPNVAFAVKKRSALDLYQRGSEEAFANSFCEDVRTAVGPAIEDMGLEWVVDDTLPNFAGENIEILIERERTEFFTKLQKEINNTKIQEIESEEQLRSKLHERDINHLLRNEELTEIVNSFREKAHSKVYAYRKLTLTLDKQRELANERYHLLLDADRRNINFEEKITKKQKELEKRFREIVEREQQSLEETRPEMLAQIERPRDIPIIIKTGSESVFPKRRFSDLLTDEYALDADSFVKGFILARRVALRRNAAVRGSILGIDGVTMAGGCEVEGDVVSRVKIVVGPYCRARNLIAPEIQFLGPCSIEGGMFCWNFQYEADDDMSLPSVAKDISIDGMVISRSPVYVEGRHVVGIISEGNINLREGSDVDYIRADGNLSIDSNCHFGVALVGGDVQINENSSGSVLYHPGEQKTEIGNHCTLQSVISEGEVDIGAETRVNYMQANGITLAPNCYIGKIDSHAEANIGEDCHLGALSASGNIYLANGVSMNDWSIISYMGQIQFDEFPVLRDIDLEEPTCFGITEDGQLSLEEGSGQLHTTLLNERLYKTIRQTTGIEQIQIQPN